ncbi:Uncharacterised protein [Bordetella pertussis]|nr:Uncharacterised protein [Bordetella pertussis]
MPPFSAGLPIGYSAANAAPGRLRASASSKAFFIMYESS